MVGHTSAFFLFPAPAGPGFPYSPYSGRKSRARVRVLLDRADHCGQVDVQHVAARGRTAGAMCVERLQPLLASCSNGQLLAFGSHSLLDVTTLSSATTCPVLLPCDPVTAL